MDEHRTTRGVHFRLRVTPTPEHGLPWELHPERYGVVTTTPKDYYLGSGFYYDTAASTARAEAENWLPPPPLNAPIDVLRARAIANDRRRLQAWAEGAWYYVTLEAEVLNLDGDPTGLVYRQEGLESDQLPDPGPWLEKVSRGLAYQITRGAVIHRIRRRPERPFNKGVYKAVRAALLAENVPGNKATATALRYARRKGKPRELLERFYRDHGLTPPDSGV